MFSLQTRFLGGGGEGAGRKGGESIYGVSYANCYAKIRTVYLIMEFIQQTLWSMQISKWNVMKEKDSKEELINKTLSVEQG